MGIEKLGTPTVGINTNFFTMAERWTAESEGLPDLRSIEIPHPLAGLPPEKIRERATVIIDEVISGLTQSLEKGKEEGKRVTVKPEPAVIKVSGKSSTEALRAVNRLFYKQRWTTGFPIVPPTQEAVEYMLTGTDREPDEVVGLVAPGGGKATIENIAINAVMAGAEPAYLPVIIAAVEAVTDPGFATGLTSWGAYGMQTTTGPATPLLIINGPAASEIGVESGIGCFSRGHRANATIGHTLRLMLINAGRSYLGINDMKGQGSSQEFTFCVAEREEDPVYHREENPWLPLNIERGYPGNSNTVTALAAQPPINVDDAEHCGPEILEAVVDTIANLGQIPYSMEWEYVLILGSTHANCLADAGWSKDNVRQYIYANAVLPWGKYKKQYPGMIGKQPAWMSRTVDDSTSVHIFAGPENVHVITAGGHCPYSQIVRCYHQGVTKQVHLPRNWNQLLADMKEHT